MVAVPDDLLTIDLSAVFPELKGQARARPPEGQEAGASHSWWADIAARRQFAGPTLLYVDDAVELFFLQVQAPGRVRVADGSLVVWNLPTRTVIPISRSARCW